MTKKEQNKLFHDKKVYIPDYGMCSKCYDQNESNVLPLGMCDRDCKTEISKLKKQINDQKRIK
jgi:hypothetical protein